MSAQGWSVKGIDPKIREAARAAAARAGMTLAEYLSAALQGQGAPEPADRDPPPRPRTIRLAPSPQDFGRGDDEEEWRPAPPTAATRTDPQRVVQRLEAIERRTQLAVAGLDRAVSTIDRSVMGLAARIEDAERASTESAERIEEALQHFRTAGETLGGRLAQAEDEVSESRQSLEHAHGELHDARKFLEGQVSLANEVARRAEAAAAFLATELESRDAAITAKLGVVEGQTREALTRSLADARAAAEAAAREAAEASADAVEELRRLQERLSDRLTETEHSTRVAVEAALAESREHARTVKDALADEIARLGSDLESRIVAAEQVRADQSDLIARIERVEGSAREATAGLRQAAGAAVADLRNAQLMLSARVKQVEAAAGHNNTAELAEMRAQQAEIIARLANLEDDTRANPVGEALAAFEQRLADIDARTATDKFAEVDGAVKTIDGALQRLAERIAETESTANSAIRTLEETVSSLGAKVEAADAAKETEALRQMLEHRLDTMAQSVTDMVDQARQDLAGQVSAAMQGAADGELEGALADVNRRLAAAERRQAQTIEAISIEIKRMSETVDRRLRAVEARNDDAAASAVREELAGMASTLERRFDDIERREAAAFDRMGLEIGRLSERLEDRVGGVEARSAQAIEQIGEQVARMGERFSHRQDNLARELGDRMLDSEERSNVRVAEAINSIMRRLSEVEEQSAEQIAPVKKAMSSVASRLEAFEQGHGEEMATPSRRFSDFPQFDDEPYVSPMDAAQPLRAGPLPPSSPAIAPPPIDSADDDIYVAEQDETASAEITFIDSVDDVAPPAELDRGEQVEFEDAFLEEPDVFAAAPPPSQKAEDDDLLWATEDEALEANETASETREEVAAPVHEAAAPPTASLANHDDIPEPPRGKHDYLKNARKAAQAQTSAKPNKAERVALRGPSRVVLWGAAGAALLLAGGAYFFTSRGEAPTPEPAQPEPDIAPPTQAAEPPAAPYDPDAAFGAPAAGEPVADAGALETLTAAPLPPRSASLEAAAASGDIVAQYELGLQRLNAGDREGAVLLLRQAANRNLAMAQYRLAKLYERGEGVPIDLVQARQWTERAAAAGNRRAMHDLGVYFARGEGAPLDEAAAFRWFRQAAELGVADSQYNLGVLYQQGRGVGASGSEALFWFLVATRQGDADAGARAETLEGQLPPAEVEQARARAAAFRPRAASALANGEFGSRTGAAPRPQA